MWFFLGIEELPLAAEEAQQPSRDIPKAGIWGLASLIVCAAIVFFLNPAVTGSEAIRTSGEPLLDGFRAFLPQSLAAVLSAFALSSGCWPVCGASCTRTAGICIRSVGPATTRKALSLTGSRQTPYIAPGSRRSDRFIALLVVNYNAGAGDVVLNIAVWGAVLAYMLQMASFVLLRRSSRTPGGRGSVPPGTGAPSSLSRSPRSPSSPS